MADKVQLIKEEIERMYKKAKSVDCFTSSVVETTLERLSDFIDSFPEEHNGDLEEEIENYIKDSLAIKFPTTDKEQIKADIKYIAHHFAEWQKQRDLEDLFKSDMTMPNKFYEKGKADTMKEMKEALQTEYEKGRFDMREEMMKDAVHAWVNTYESVTNPYDNQVSFITNLSPSKFRNKETAQIIIVKTEQQ